MNERTRHGIARRTAPLWAGMIAAVSALACLIGSPNVSAGDAPKLPEGKQTKLGLYVTSSEAYEKWKAAPGKVRVLDVRTPDEFLFLGHADMAWNVPVAAQTFAWDEAKKQFPMRLLPDFVDRVRKMAGPQDTLLVMCRSGGRSAIAVNMLAAAGFKDVYNITDGFEGDTVQDPGSVFDGQHMVNGWRNSGLPWTYDVDPARMVLGPDR
jgi:rhodanese-related sulfurtransferase